LGTWQGFAVVAAGSPQAAERSQKAAGEINQLSGTTVKVSEKAGEMLSKLVPDIQRTAESCRKSPPPARNKTPAQSRSTKHWCSSKRSFSKMLRIGRDGFDTEELTSQSEQLVSALAFSTPGKRPHTMRAGSPKTDQACGYFAAAAIQGQGIPCRPRETMAARPAPESLKLKDKDKGGRSGKEFERF